MDGRRPELDDVAAEPTGRRRLRARQVLDVDAGDRDDHEPVVDEHRERAAVGVEERGRLRGHLLEDGVGIELAPEPAARLGEPLRE